MVKIMEMQGFYRVLDPYLIWSYRLTGYGWLDFIIGTAVLAALCKLAGDLTVVLVSFLTRNRVDRYAEDALKYQQLSMDALKSGNKEAYTAANKLANEAFGHSFFQQFTVSAAFLWPVFFSLAWMQYRFLDLEIPIPGTRWSLGFIAAFIPIYVATCFVWKRARGSGFIRRIGANLPPFANR
jgi:hypothetical protein